MVVASIIVTRRFGFLLRTWHQPNRTLSTRKMRRPVALFFLLLFAIFSSSQTRAALQFDVHVGYEGNVHEASWFPIVCEIFNDGPSFNAVIEVSSGGQFANEQLREIGRASCR